MKSGNASVNSHDTGRQQSQSDTLGTLSRAALNETKVTQLIQKAHNLYSIGRYKEALEHCEVAYDTDAFRTENLLLLGAIHFQLRNYSESIFYNQQCIR
jgi:tetratricopeptide (TPR) repeat protein